MRWSLKWHKQVATGQYYDLLRRGFFDKKPEELEPSIEGFEFYIDAFRELSTSRPVGLELQAIPFTAIAEYFRIYSLQDDFEDFAYYIRVMDRTFMDTVSAEKTKEGNKNGSANANPPNPNKR